MITDSEVTLEKVNYSDLKNLEKLFIKAFSSEVHPEYFKRRISRVRQFYYFLRPLMRVSPWVKNLFNIYIIKVNHVMVGFLQVSYLNKKQLHLDYIAINKNYRGQGLGSLVMHRLLEETSERKGLDIVLEVNSHNLTALQLYKKLGFYLQTSILHYERDLGVAKMNLVPPFIPGLRKLHAGDRAKLFHLYQNSLPVRLQSAIPREYSDFTPSMFTRNLEWVKNKLMRVIKTEYVVEMHNRLVAWFEVISYPKIASHTISMVVHKNYETLRMPLLKHIYYTLKRKYAHGTMATTIYDDSPQKQQTLEKLGFAQKETYLLLIRHPRERSKRYTTPVNQVRWANNGSAPHLHRNNQPRRTVSAR